MTLSELKKWFRKQKLPKELRINAWSYTSDLEFTVNALISCLEHNKKNRGYLPYYEQLMEIKEKLEAINKMGVSVKSEPRSVEV